MLPHCGDESCGCQMGGSGAYLSLDGFHESLSERAMFGAWNAVRMTSQPASPRMLQNCCSSCCWSAIEFSDTTGARR